jgi:hypothetical protein
VGNSTYSFFLDLVDIDPILDDCANQEHKHTKKYLIDNGKRELSTPIIVASRFKNLKAQSSYFGPLLTKPTNHTS